MKKRTRFERLWQVLPAGWLAALLAVLPLQAAHATDGVIQINQARALAGGVTPGDAPGFPVTITEPGSYILTSGLDVTGEANPESVTAITVTADGAKINMNGFGIRGPTTCSPPPASSCSPTGTGVGILVTTGLGHVENGAITGMGYRGIDMSGSGMGVVRVVAVYHSGENGIVLPAASFVDEVTAIFNGGVGMKLGLGSLVDKSEALSNSGHGIQVGGASRVSDSVASGNGGSGIEVGGGSRVSGSVASGNGGSGISMADAAVAEKCIANLNGDAGIANAGGGIVRDSAATGNATDGIRIAFSAMLTHNHSTNNTGDGIDAGQASTVIGNTVFQNGGYGLNLGSGTGYQGNVVKSNTTGTVNGTSLVEMGGNACGGDSVCP